MSAETLLEVENVRKRFGGVRALDGVSLEVRAGAVYGLIGPNGSGKTTLFNVVTGFLRPDSGHVRFRGRPLDGLSPDRIARLGLCRTFQANVCPQRMTVMENMLLAGQPQTGESLVKAMLRPGRVRAEERSALERARGLLELVGLGKHADHYAGELSGGQKKLLSLAQALMASPRLVLLDEPVAGVNPKLVDHILEVISRLRGEGWNFLLVEHNMRVIRTVCDRVSVLDAGRVIAEGPAAETLARDEVLHAYLAPRREAETSTEASG